jgi:hypothetical protein
MFLIVAIFHLTSQHVETYQITCHIREHQLNAILSGNRRIGIVIVAWFLRSQGRPFHGRHPIVAAQAEYDLWNHPRSKDIGMPAGFSSRGLCLLRTLLLKGWGIIPRSLSAIPRGYRVLLPAVVPIRRVSSPIAEVADQSITVAKREFILPELEGTQNEI